MRYGICLNSSALAAGYEAGFDFAELAVAELKPLEDEAVFAPIRAALLSSPLPVQACNCFLPAALKVVGPEIDVAAIRAYMEVALRRASEVDVGVVVFGSGGARRAPDDFSLQVAEEQFSAAARMAADIAARYNIIIAIEPLNTDECNIVNMVAEGAQIVKAVDHPHLRLLADIFHMVKLGDDFSNLSAVMPYLAHIHTDSFSLPGLHGGVDYDGPAFFTPLIQGGYQGRLSLEDHSNFLANEQNALPQVELFRKQLAVLKGLWSSTATPEEGG